MLQAQKLFYQVARKVLIKQLNDVGVYFMMFENKMFGSSYS